MNGAQLVSFIASINADGTVNIVAVSNAEPLPVTLSGGIGGLSVAGTEADDSAAGAQFPVTVAGWDPNTGLLHRLKTDATGALEVVGASGGGDVQGLFAAGTVNAPNPVIIGGLDAGGVLRDWLMDAAGHGIMVGPGATGAAPVGNPLFMSGSDGALLRALLTDTGGRQIMVGAAAAGAAVAGNPVLVAGSDGANARALLLDANGHPLVAGTTAQGTAVSGNPLLVGLRAATAAGAAQADGQATYARADKVGRVNVVPYQVRDLISQSGVITLTTTAETTLFAAGGAGVFEDMLSIKLINTSATPVRLDVRDTTGGTIVDTWELPANATIGQTFAAPFKQTTANSNWTVQLAAAVTDVRVVAQFAANI